MKRLNIILIIILFNTIGCTNGRQSATEDFLVVDVTIKYPKKELILQDFFRYRIYPIRNK